MYEFTHKGAWFRWESLDPADRRLAGLSLVAAMPAGCVVGVICALHGYRAVYALVSGKRAPVSHMEELVAELAPSPALVTGAMLAALGCALISALAWWRFSLRQDEMFNRIQNHAIGHASGWTLGGAAIWWFLEQARLAPSLPVGAWLLLAYALVCLFWLRAVRRWA